MPDTRADSVHRPDTRAGDTRPARSQGKSQGRKGGDIGSTIQYLTPPEYAARLGVDPATVIGWIRSGELRAIDTARRGSRRPRYRISPAAIIDFEGGRAVQPPAPRASRRRTPERPAGWVSYYGGSR